jgi:MFS family permease
MAAKVYTPAPAGARETRGAARRWWVLAVASVAQLMVVLDVTVVNIALPSAQRALAFSDADRQWVVTAYALAFGSLLLIGGKLSDLLGRNRTFMAGLAGFAAASALAGAAPNFAVLAAGRAAQGAFGALLAPAALAIVTATFAGSPARGRAFAIFGAVAGIAGAIGLLLGGLLTEYLNWRWTLYVNLAFAAIGLIGAAAFLRRGDRPAHRPKIDLPGTVLVSAGLFLLVFGLSRAQVGGWHAPASWLSLTGAAALLAAFAGWQARAAAPLLPLLTGSLMLPMAPSANAMPTSIDVADLEMENNCIRVRGPAKAPGYDSCTISPRCRTTNAVVNVLLCSSDRLWSRSSNR